MLKKKWAEGLTSKRRKKGYVSGKPIQERLTNSKGEDWKSTSETGEGR